MTRAPDQVRTPRHMRDRRVTWGALAAVAIVLTAWYVLIVAVMP
jgi:hypothetical protein